MPRHLTSDHDIINLACQRHLQPKIMRRISRDDNGATFVCRLLRIVLLDSILQQCHRLREQC